MVVPWELLAGLLGLGQASAVPAFVGIDMALGGIFGSGSWVGDTAYSLLAVPGSLSAALPSSIELHRWLC